MQIVMKVPCNEVYVMCLTASSFAGTYKSIKVHKNPTYPHQNLQNVEEGVLQENGGASLREKTAVS